MRVTAELEDEHHEHQERHKEVQAVQFCDTRKHKRDYRDATLRVAELTCKKESCKYVENTRRKGRGIDNGHNPLVVSHVVERTRRPQMKHHDVYASQESKAIKRREVIRFCFFHKNLF